MNRLKKIIISLIFVLLNVFLTDQSYSQNSSFSNKTESAQASCDEYVVLFNPYDPIKCESINSHDYQSGNFSAGYRVDISRDHEYARRVQNKQITADEIQTKINAISHEARTHLQKLRKCATRNPNTEDLVAINEQVFWGSYRLNDELQKTIYRIQRFIYDNHTGEFIGIQSADDVIKLSKIIDAFEYQLTKWRNSNSNVIEDLNADDYPPANPYDATWHSKIQRNSYNRDLFKVIKLCSNTDSVKAKENIKKAQEIASWQKQAQRLPLIDNEKALIF